MPRKTNSPAAPAAKPTAAIAVAIAALAAFVILAFGNIVATSPTNDEVPHLAAGWTYVTLGDYRMNLEHPPLLKQLAALPLLGVDVWPRGLHEAGDGSRSLERLLSEWRKGAHDRSAEWPFAHRLFYSLRDAALERVGTDAGDVPTTERFSRDDFLNDADRLFRRGRMAMLLTGAALALLVFFWSRELWGWGGAALSAVLFCFDPNFIAHSGLITTDVGVTTFLFGAVYFLWRTTRRWSWPSAIACVLFFALAQVAKFSAILLLPIVLLIAAWRVVSGSEWNIDGKAKRTAVLLGLVAACGLASVGVIWATYAFQYEPARNAGGTMELKPEIQTWYASKSLLDTYPLEGPPDAEVVRASRYVTIGLIGRTLLNLDEWRILPKGYTMGLAATLRSTVFRRGYLGGRYTMTGFPEYFFATILFKTPIPTLVLVIAGLVAALRRGGMWVVFIPVAVYLGYSIASPVNIGHRHILPIYPFLYVAAGALGAKLGSTARWTGVLTVVAASSLVVVAPPALMWGNHLAYMNEFAGGPKRGDRILVDSNLDWGQDLGHLGRWLDERKITEPVNLVYFGQADPKYYGIRHLNMNFGYIHEKPVPVEAAAIPGYFAISTNHLRGIMYGRPMRYFWPEYLAKHGARHVGTAGSSIQIYRVER